MDKIRNFFAKKGIRKAILFLIGMLLLYLISRRLGIDLLDPENRTRLQELVDENILAASLIYVATTIVGSVLLALPGMSFAIIAGMAFGPILGTALCSIATTIGAVGSFLAGRYFLKDAIEPMIRKNKKLEALLLSGSNKNAMLLLMITRLLPVFPYNLQNFAYGITDVKLLPYTVYSLIFMLPGTAMFTVGAFSLTENENRLLYLGITAGLVIFVFGISYLLKKYMEKNPPADETA